jgi:hypothetical protein
MLSVPIVGDLDLNGPLTGNQNRNLSTVSGTDVFLQTLATMNEAAHGLEVEPGAATEALRVASDLLAELVAFRRNGGL